MTAPTEAFGVTVKADFRDFEKALLRAQNQTDTKLSAMERRFTAANSNVKRQTGALAGAAKSGLTDLTQSISGAGAGLPGLGAGMSRLGVAGAAAAVGVGALMMALRGVAEAGKFAADLTDAADRIGVGVEALQELRYAADETGVPLASLDSALEALNGTLGAFKTNIGAGKIKPVFKALGITAEDLQDVHNANDLLPILAEKLSQISDRATQVQLARKLGIEALLPLLRQGSDGMARMAKEGRDLGLVMSSDVVAGLDETDRALEKNQQQIAANVRSMQANLAPFFLWATDGFAKLTRSVGDFINALGRAENRNGRVLADQSTTLQRKVSAAYGQADRQPGGRLTAVQQGWVRELAEVNAQIAARARASIAADTPSAETRARETAQPEAPGGGGGGGARGSRTDSSRQVLLDAKEALRNQRQFDDALAAVQQNILKANEDQAVTARERRDAALAALERDDAARKLDLDRQVTDGDITAAQRKQLAEADAALSTARKANISRKAEEEILADRLVAEQRVSDFTAEALQIRSAGATTDKERQVIARELLALAQTERRQALERIAANTKASPEERSAATTMLGMLPGREAAESGALGQQSRPAQEAGGIAQGVLNQSNLGADTATMYAEIDRLRQADILNEQQAAQARAQINSQYWQARLSGEQTMLDGLASLSQSSNKKLAAIGKAAAIAQATIDGILAVQKALASSPPPMNFIAATAAGVVAAANVASIAGMADGGPVRGPGGPRSDVIPTMLSNGEFVVNAAATKKARPLLEAINAGALLGFNTGGLVTTGSDGPEPRTIAYVDRQCPVAVGHGGGLL